jgi:hypothetical protein
LALAPLQVEQETSQGSQVYVVVLLNLPFGQLEIQVFESKNVVVQDKQLLLFAPLQVVHEPSQGSQDPLLS